MAAFTMEIKQAQGSLIIVAQKLDSWPHNHVFTNAELRKIAKKGANANQ
jgi:hypothetical protein